MLNSSLHDEVIRSRFATQYLQNVAMNTIDEYQTWTDLLVKSCEYRTLESCEIGTEFYIFP